MAESAKNQLSEISVLVAEDDAFARSTLVDMLKALEIKEVVEFENGELAWKYLAASKGGVHIILCDWGMPVMDGFELAQKAKKEYPRIPFIMVTGKNDAATVEQARKLPIDGYVVKPFSLKKIEEKIRYALNKQNRNKQNRNKQNRNKQNRKTETANSQSTETQNRKQGSG